MEARRFSEAQIIHLLHRAERGGQPTGALCREPGISEQPVYRWRQKFGGLTVSNAQRWRELGREHARLKRLLAARDLDIGALQALLVKRS